MPPVKGVMRFLVGAKEGGHRIALSASAGREKLLYHLRRVESLPFFDVLMASELCREIKPSLDLDMKVAGLLGVSSEECLVIEDSANGLLAVMGAHTQCLIMPTTITRHCDFSGTFLVLDFLGLFDFDEVTAVFDQGGRARA